MHQILEPGQTGIMDRGYQRHQNFDDLQEEQKHFRGMTKDNVEKVTNTVLKAVGRSVIS